MIYLASPYSDSDPMIMERRYNQAASFTAGALKRGFLIFSPIVHCHVIANRFGLPKSISFWRDYNTGMLRIAERLWILKIDGWQRSEGVEFELHLASSLNLPIEHVTEDQWSG